MEIYPLQNKDLDTPCLLLDLDVLEKNLMKMQSKADEHKVQLRPHMKTHKMISLAQKQIDHGAIGITVAKVGEAEVMAQGGIKDIFIANQVVTSQKIDRIVKLAAKIKLSVGIDSLEGGKRLSEAFSSLGSSLSYLIEINTGLNRCGVKPKEEAWELYQKLQELPGLFYQGIFTHAGHAYGAKSVTEVKKISDEECRLMEETRQFFKQRGVFSSQISIGSTPTMSVWQGYEGITEIRPGNYVFNDATQVSLGCALPENCALTVLATVISVSRRRAVIDAGSKVFALDRGAHGKDTLLGHGVIIGKNSILACLSEEHGVIDIHPNDTFFVGEVLRIIPNHSCTVINLFDQVYGISRGRVKGEFSIEARGKCQ